MARRCSLAKVVHSKQQVSLQLGKRLTQIGISMMRMDYGLSVKKISMEAHTTLIKKVSCKQAGPLLMVTGTILQVLEL